MAQDYNVRLEWDKFTRQTSFTNGEYQAEPGVRVVGKSWHGMVMEVEFVQVDAPRRAAMKMVHGPFFFKSFAGTWEFIEKQPEQTLVKFHYNFKTRWSWLSMITDPIVSSVLKRDVNLRLNCLKRAVEQTDIYSRTAEYKSNVAV